MRRAYRTSLDLFGAGVSRSVLIVACFAAGVGCTSQAERGWQAASETDSVESYSEFVEAFSESPHVAEAKARIAAKKYPLSKHGLDWLSRSEGVTWGCSGAEEALAPPGVAYTADETNTISYSMMSHLFGWSGNGTVARADSTTPTGTMFTQDGQVTFGNHCFRDAQTKDPLQVNGSYTRVDGGWRLREGTMLIVSTDIDRKAQAALPQK